MTLMGAINHIDAVKPNGYSQTEKVKWLSTLDGIVKAEIIDIDFDKKRVSLSIRAAAEEETAE